MMSYPLIFIDHISHAGRCLQAPLADVPRWQLEMLLGCGLRNASLYRRALIHPTALLPEARVASFERLEYLGDAVLELCTRQLLMDRAPTADEVCCIQR